MSEGLDQAARTSPLALGCLNEDRKEWRARHGEIWGGEEYSRRRKEQVERPKAGACLLAQGVACKLLWPVRRRNEGTCQQTRPVAAGGWGGMESHEGRARTVAVNLGGMRNHEWI